MTTANAAPASRPPASAVLRTPNSGSSTPPVNDPPAMPRLNAADIAADAISVLPGASWWIRLCITVGTMASASPATASSATAGACKGPIRYRPSSATLSAATGATIAVCGARSTSSPAVPVPTRSATPYTSSSALTTETGNLLTSVRNGTTYVYAANAPVTA